MDAITAFNTERDIPYRIPLTPQEHDACCSGKATRLKAALEKLGYTVRYRVCDFVWSEVGLPDELFDIPREDHCTHTYLEVLIEEHWIVVDPTWDNKQTRFPVNEWDGKTDTKVAVRSISIYGPERSAEILLETDEAAIKADLATNKEFYAAFNEWLEESRNPEETDD
jgi:hypothetical protein